MYLNKTHNFKSQCFMNSHMGCIHYILQEDACFTEILETISNDGRKAFKQAPALILQPPSSQCSMLPAVDSGGLVRGGMWELCN